jgi:hypothetical protein
MAYSAEISRANPTCFVFLLDQSGSMSDPFGGGGTRKKADSLADATNRLLQNLVIKCAKEEGIRDYFHIAIIGYGASVGSAYSGALAGRDIVPVSEIGNSPARIEERMRERDDGAGGLVKEQIKFPVWVDPVANGGTPMGQALMRAKDLADGWVRAHPSGFPPIILNITDGEATDGDPSGPADALRNVQSTDGAALLLNLHLSSTAGVPITFPDSEAELPDQFAKALFRMSSALTPAMRTAAASEGFRTSEATRGFAFNADMVSLVKFLDIGTRPSNLR